MAFLSPEYLRDVFLFCIALIPISRPAFAAGDSSAPLAPSAVMDEPMGDARLVVFSTAPPRPLENVTVRVLDVILGRTNEDGALDISLLGGLYHLTFDIGADDTRTEAIRITPGESIEVVVGVPPGSDQLLFQVERQAPDAGVEPVERRSDQVGVIEGAVLSEETGRPLSGARIFVRGYPTEARTDPLGRFRIEVPVGRHDIVVVHPDYDTVTSRNIEVAKDTSSLVNIRAAQTSLELSEMVVTSPRISGSEVDILKERRETKQVSDIIGAEQFGKSGDSNAASALKRVTGITIVGGKYVYVRGLGERYSSTTLNGLNLPSPDPERRVVPLDMFPAEILDSMKIQKTFSPEMPGDFGGGTVNLRTKGYPSDLLLKLSVSGSVVTDSTFHMTDVAADSGPTDSLGIDGGHRELPGIVARAVNTRPLVRKSAVGDGFSLEELSELTQAMPDSWKTASKRVPPNLKLAVTAGNGWRIKKTKLGFLTAFLYKNDWDTADIFKAEYANDNGRLVAQNRYEISDAVNTINLGGILTAGVDLGEDNQILLNTLVARITDNDFYTYEAYHADFDARVYNYEWTERMLLSQQLMGSHRIFALHNLEVSWRYAFSRATRIEPDKRFVQYDYVDPSRTTLSASLMANANRRDFLEAGDQIHDLGLDLTLPFKQWFGEDASIKVGGGVTLKNRETDIRRFAYGNLGALSEEARRQPPWELFSKKNAGVDGMRLIEVTQGTDNYTGALSVFSGFISGELPLGAGFTASGGVRLEKGAQEVSTFAMFDSDDARIVRRFDNLDVLPALVLTYDIRDDLLVRLGYGKTLSRPDFKEMSPGCSMSYAGAGDICGAPEEIPNPAWTPDSPSSVPAKIPFTLKPAVIHNVDARLEWYFTKAESLSFGAFYKVFLNPIESVFRSSTDKATELRNAVKARNVGLELSFKKNFGFIRDALEDLYMAGNASWIFSRIEMPKSNLIIQTNRTRPLQGQSPFVVNGHLGYDNVDLGLSAVLLYNVFGKRIATVGVDGLQDIYEQPFHQLDFVAKKRIRKGFEAGLKFGNIINAASRFTQEDRSNRKQHTTRSTKKGRSFSLSLSWSY